MKGDNKLSVSTTLRYNEYYGMQETFDWLYDRSKKKATKGLRLYEIITSRENILLAYRNIKANTGSKTAGTDGLTIEDYKIKNENSFIEEIGVPCTLPTDYTLSQNLIINKRLSLGTSIILEGSQA